MSRIPFSRRRFIQAGAGAVTVVGLGACTDDGVTLPVGPTSTVPAAPSTAPASTTATTSVTSTTAPGAGGPRRLVVVQLNGGNDMLNTLPPSDGRYQDLRPGIAIPEADRLALTGETTVALHPSLAPMLPHWEAGHLALVQGIGFPDPNRSHFVSMDRWWRADELTRPGWLGRVLDAEAGQWTALAATGIGGAAPLLNGATAQPTIISSPGAFQLQILEPSWLDFGSGDATSLAGRYRQSLATALEAMEDFAGLVTEAEDSADLPEFAGGNPISDGLATAAALLAADVGARIVVVSASGFDTHSGQPSVQAGLLADLAQGLSGFQQAMDAGGLGQDVLVVTTSEFGRRAAENASEGTDHGAGGLSIVLGDAVQGGRYGSADLGDLLDGDIRPVIDPRAMYTACLDWLGADVEAVLGRRYDSLSVLR